MGSVGIPIRKIPDLAIRVDLRQHDRVSIRRHAEADVAIQIVGDSALRSIGVGNRVYLRYPGRFIDGVYNETTLVRKPPGHEYRGIRGVSDTPFLTAISGNFSEVPVFVVFLVTLKGIDEALTIRRPVERVEHRIEIFGAYRLLISTVVI